MPILEYRCGACGERFEQLRARADEPTPCCPRCGAGRVDRQWSVFAVPRAAAGQRKAGPCGSSDCACVRDGQDA
ncbi:MAG: zinc ribbon domain-containing protein [Candidatus Eisenbacteria bacterium]